MEASIIKKKMIIDSEYEEIRIIYRFVGMVGYRYHKNFLNERETSNLYDLCESYSFIEYPYRGKTLTRSPKIEFKTNENIGVYRFGQETNAYSLVNNYMPDIFINILEKINDPNINYVTVIKYNDGKRHHIPWHSDKQEGTISAGAKDIAGGTNIYNINVFSGTNRLFQVAKPENINGKIANVYEFNKRMKNGSMFVLSSSGNKNMKHQVPKEKNWNGCRYSIVLRSIKEWRVNDSRVGV